MRASFRNTKQCLVFTMLFCTACVSQGQICLLGIDECSYRTMSDLRSHSCLFAPSDIIYTHKYAHANNHAWSHTHLSSIIHRPRLAVMLTLFFVIACMTKNDHQILCSDEKIGDKKPATLPKAHDNFKQQRLLQSFICFCTNNYTQSIANTLQFLENNVQLARCCTYCIIFRFLSLLS